VKLKCVFVIPPIIATGVRAGGLSRFWPCSEPSLVFIDETKMADDHDLSSRTSQDTSSTITKGPGGNTASSLKIQAIDIFRASQLGYVLLLIESFIFYFTVDS